MADFKRFVDPAAKFIKDWNWKPLEEVAKKTPKAVPDYVQEGYGAFMQDQLNRAMKGELSPRDVLKAFGITQSSIGRQGVPHATATKTGMKIPKTDELVRPEGAFAEWLGSPAGQQFLMHAERGEVHPGAMDDLRQKFSPFGKQNQLVDQLTYGVENAPSWGTDVNRVITGNVDDYRDWAEGIKGVAGAKTGFIGSLLGRGDLPTFDARQINLHTEAPPVGMESIMKRGRGQGAREAVDRLAARQTAMEMELDPSLMPFYQHLGHHAVWDKVGDSATTHEDLVRAMQNYADGGEVRAFSGGGTKGKIIQAGLDMIIPKNTVKAYKLFRTNPEGDLHALYVNADKKFPIGKWIPAEIGQAAGNGKVKSSIGNLAFRPGLHAGSAPTATHIGGALGPRIDPKTGEYFMTKSGKIKKVPTERRPDEVWAEIDMPNDFDWQTIANERGMNSKGILIPKNAHITDQIPVGGHYRYKTNPNMEGEWLIGGGMKINKVLTDEEVEAANRAAGVVDLPRTQPSVFPYDRFDFNQPIAESSAGLDELLKYYGKE